MMRFLVFLFLFPLCLFGQEDSTSVPKSDVLLRARYKVKIGVVHAVNTELTLRNVLHDQDSAEGIFITSKSVGVFELLLKLKDSWVSIMDKETGQPKLFLASIQEGKYKDKSKIQFDSEKQYTHLQKFNFIANRWTDTLSYRTPYPVYDVVSALHQLRNVDFEAMEVGEIVSYNVFFEGRLFRFALNFKGKEVIKTKQGKMSCILLQPEVPVGKQFKSPDAVSIWISDDKLRIPVRISADMKVGKVDIILKNIVSFM